MKAPGARARDTVAAAAMAAVAFVGFVVVDVPSRPVRAARSIGATAAPARMVPPATARSVLLRADALELDAGQRAPVLHRDVAALLAQVSEDFGQFADRVPRAGRARLAICPTACKTCRRCPPRCANGDADTRRTRSRC